MKYSISNWIYGDEPLEATLQRLQRYGYDGVELKGEPEIYHTEEVKALCRKYGLEVLSIAGIYPWPTQDRDLASPDTEARKRAVNYLKSCIDLASQVGAPLVVVVPSAVGKVSPAEKFQDEEEWVDAKQRELGHAVQSVREAAEYAQSREIFLAVEPINRYETFLVNTAEEGLSFAEQVNSPAVKMHLDVFHMNIEESDPADAILRCGELLVNFHVADSNRRAVGEGHIDFGVIMRALKEIHYQGPLTLEPLPAVPDPYIAARLKRYEPFRDIYAEQCITRLRKLEEEI
jgi:sugar phosphate isomerase/epimerase